MIEFKLREFYNS